MTVRKNGSTIRFGSKKTDNTNLSHKVFLRRMAIEHLAEVNVLDLFAGEGRVWKRLAHDTYTGIDIVDGKNPSVIVGNNKAIIPKLDLSRYNVIDCDSYGIPSDQIALLYENGTMLPGTVIVYTCIANKVSQMPKKLMEYAGIVDMHPKAETLFNKYSIELFFDLLAHFGAKSVWEYEEPPKKGYTKKYGYFVV